MFRRIFLAALLSALAAAHAHATSTVGDFDADGRDELLLRDEGSGGWMYYDLDEDGATGRELALEMADTVRFRGVGDFDGDGAAEILARDVEDGSWRYFDGTDGDFAEVLVPDIAAENHWTDWTAAAIGDFNGDGRDDVMLRRYDNGRAVQYFMDGAEARASGGLRVTRNLLFDVLGAGDFNGDGRDDVLLRHAHNGQWIHYDMADARGFLRRPGLTPNLLFEFQAIGDFNGDGREDVLLRHAGNGAWIYYAMGVNHRGKLTRRFGMARDSAFRLVAAGDFDGDGVAVPLLRHRNVGSWVSYDLAASPARRVQHSAMTTDLAWVAASVPVSGCGGLRDEDDPACAILEAKVCPNGAPAADNPLLCERGSSFYEPRFGDQPSILPGIDRLPLDRVQLTNEQMQLHFAIVENQVAHAKDVGTTACDSYVTASEQCELHANRAGIVRYPEGDEETRTGLIPFTQILDLQHGGFVWRREQINAMQDLRIFSLSKAPSESYLGNADKPYLLVRGAGNGGSNHSWFLEDHRSDRQRDVITRAIAANKLLFVAGVIRDVNGNYIRHPTSSSCKDVDDGCLWTWFEFTINFSGTFQGVAGTSHSTPNIAASLAAVLSVFPDTEHQDLAKLARACAKKTGEGIDGPHGLLATSGGFGVADFSCVDEITAASVDLAANETATLTIDGREVTVTPRSITVREDTVE